jgi:hypothetical protein
MISKQPSASVKPVSQEGSLISVEKTVGLSTGMLSGKEENNSFVKPLFIDALMLRIFSKPSLVRCCLLFIISKTK